MGPVISVVSCSLNKSDIIFLYCDYSAVWCIVSLHRPNQYEIINQVAGSFPLLTVTMGPTTEPNLSWSAGFGVDDLIN